MYLFRCLLHKSYFSLYAWITRQLIDNSYIEPPQNQNNVVSYSGTDSQNIIFIAITILLLSFLLLLLLSLSSLVLLFLFLII